jgi:hypothetical protein
LKYLAQCTFYKHLNEGSK